MNVDRDIAETLLIFLRKSWSKNHSKSFVCSFGDAARSKQEWLVSETSCQICNHLMRSCPFEESRMNLCYVLCRFSNTNVLCRCHPVSRYSCILDNSAWTFVQEKKTDFLSFPSILWSLFLRELTNLFPNQRSNNTTEQFLNFRRRFPWTDAPELQSHACVHLLVFKDSDLLLWQLLIHEVEIKAEIYCAICLTAICLFIWGPPVILQLGMQRNVISANEPQEGNIPGSFGDWYLGQLRREMIVCFLKSSSTRRDSCGERRLALIPRTMQQVCRKMTMLSS